LLAIIGPRIIAAWLHVRRAITTHRLATEKRRIAEGLLAIIGPRIVAASLSSRQRRGITAHLLATNERGAIAAHVLARVVAA